MPPGCPSSFFSLVHIFALRSSLFALRSSLDIPVQSIAMAVSDVLLLLSALFTRSLVEATCYRPNGQPVNDPRVQPCNQAGGDTVSMCCGLNRIRYPDQCLSNGLCSGGGNVFRNSCTDKTWKSPLCLNLCTTGGAEWTAVGVSEG